MSWYTGAQYLQAAANQQAEVEVALAKNAQLRLTHLQRRDEVAQRYQHAFEEALAAILPSMSPEHLARAVALTGYSPLTQHDHTAAMAAEREGLVQRIATIEADSRFQDRELLRAPHVGTLTHELDELLDYRRSLMQVLSLCEHARMEALIESGYGTPDYAVPFWRMSYYNDWEAGDQILARWPGKAFSEVRIEYLGAQGSIASYDARIADLEREIAAGAALEVDHQRSTEALTTIVPRYLARARENLGRHLSDCGFRVLGDRLATEPAVAMLAKRVSGLGHKLDYLDNLAAHYLDTADADLQALHERNARDVVKYGRAKNRGARIPAEVFQQRFRPRAPRWQKGWSRYEQAHDTVYRFDRYDDSRLVQDFLWWDLMTDGRLDGDFIPEVQEHHRANPAYQFTRPAGFDDDEASAAVAQGDQAGSSGSPFTDPS